MQAILSVVLSDNQQFDAALGLGERPEPPALQLHKFRGARQAVLGKQALYSEAAGKKMIRRDLLLQPLATLCLAGPSL